MRLEIIANQKRGQGEASTRDRNGRRMKMRGDKPQGNRKGRPNPGGSTERKRHKSRQDTKDRRQTKANENKHEHEHETSTSLDLRTKARFYTSDVHCLSCPMKAVFGAVFGIQIMLCSTKEKRKMKI